jgi:hypothetical protein
MKILAKLAPLVAALLLSACMCGGNRETVALVQSLSLPRLEQLHRDLTALQAAYPNTVKTFDRATGIPSAFADLHPEAVVIDPVMTRIHLSGCVDDKVMILLRDFGKEDQELVLLKGEAQGEVVLWRGK